MDMFLQRGDKYIQCTELLAVLMAWQVFKPWLKHARWTAYVDNKAVIGALIRGRAAPTADDVSRLIGNLWTELACSSVCFHVVYVASKSNPADGPTREDWKLVSEVLKAEVMQADFPVWCWQLWGPLQVPFEFNT